MPFPFVCGRVYRLLIHLDCLKNGIFWSFEIKLELFRFWFAKQKRNVFSYIFLGFDWLFSRIHTMNPYDHCNGTLREKWSFYQILVYMQIDCFITWTKSIGQMHSIIVSRIWLKEKVQKLMCHRVQVNFVKFSLRKFSSVMIWEFVSICSVLPVNELF